MNRKIDKETTFLIYCLERYRYYKHMSGPEAVDLFEKYHLYEYITKYFGVLHTMGDLAIVEDLDQFIGETENPDKSMANCVAEALPKLQ